MPADDRAKIEAAAAKLKTAHDNKDFAGIDAATAELQGAWQSASAKMYQQGGGAQQPGADFNGGFNQQAGPQGGAQGPQGGANNGNDQEVQDVDFEEVK